VVLDERRHETLDGLSGVELVQEEPPMLQLRPEALDQRVAVRHIDERADAAKKTGEVIMLDRSVLGATIRDDGDAGRPGW